MSHDIYFWHAEQGKPNHAEVRGFLEGLQNFKVNDLQDGQWQGFYENPDTGVCFPIDVDLEEAGKQPDSESAGEAGKGYWNTGLSFCLNYFRPSFFGLEAMPIIERFVRRFDLVPYDPQEDQVVRDCDASVLNGIWQRHNQHVIREFRSRPEFDQFHALPRKTMMAWWEYSRKKGSLQQSQSEDVFVPSIMFLKEKNTGNTRRAIVWPDAIPEVFPACDMIIIGRETKKWFGLRKSQQQGWLPFEDVMERIAFALEPMPDAGPDARILHAGKENDVRNLFLTWPLNHFDKSDFEGIPVHRIVDLDESHG